MGFKDAVAACFRKYFTFSGRASRPEYWWFFLFVILGSFAAGIVDAAVFGAATVQTGPGRASFQSNGPATALFSLGTFIPSISAGWRRMHDSGRSGLFLLYPLIVMIGMATFASLAGVTGRFFSGGAGDLFQGAVGIVLVLCLFVFFVSPLLVLWWLTRPSTPGPNRFGAQPGGITP